MSDFDVDVFRDEMRDQINTDADRNIYRAGSGSFYIDTGNIPIMNIVPDEENIIDILPFIVTTKNHPKFDELKQKFKDKPIITYEMTVFVHKGLGPGNNQSFICPKQTYGLPCPVCERSRELYGQMKNTEDVDELKYIEAQINKYKAKPRTLILVKNKLTNRIEIMDYSYHWFLKNLIAESKRARSEREVLLPDFTDQGHSIRFFADRQSEDYRKKDGTLGSAEIKSISFIPRQKGEGYSPSLLKELKGLDTMITVKSYDEIANIISGTNVTVNDLDVDTNDRDDRPLGIKEKDEEEFLRVNTEASSEVGGESKVAIGQVKNTVMSETKEETAEERRARIIASRANKEEKVEPECPEGLKYGEDTYTSDMCVGCSIEASCYKVYQENGN